MKRQHTKIIATLGNPETTYQEGIYTGPNLDRHAKPKLEDVVNLFFEAGVDVIRINLAHLPHEEVALGKKFGEIKSAILNAEAHYQRRVGVLADLPGPKIRFRKAPWLLPKETLYIVFDKKRERLATPKNGTECAPTESTACVHLDQVHDPELAVQTILDKVRDKLNPK